MAIAASAIPTQAMPEGAATAIAKHSLTIAGHRTSISLEQAFWDALRDISRARGQSLATLIGEIDAARGAANLSSAIRVFVLSQTRAQ
jgi:predicted DNA-binding ribbon-helix-helix protein